MVISKDYCCCKNNISFELQILPKVKDPWQYFCVKYFHTESHDVGEVYSVFNPFLIIILLWRIVLIGAKYIDKKEGMIGQCIWNNILNIVMSRIKWFTCATQIWLVCFPSPFSLPLWIFFLSMHGTIKTQNAIIYHFWMETKDDRNYYYSYVIVLLLYILHIILS